jgi:hypothetical protein
VAKACEDSAVIVWEDYFANFTVERSHEASLVLEGPLLCKCTVQSTLRSQDVYVVARVCQTDNRTKPNLNLFFERQVFLFYFPEAAILTSDKNAAKVAVD